jgi:hypothetical protein
MNKIILIGLCLIFTSCTTISKDDRTKPKESNLEISIIEGFYVPFTKDGISANIFGYRKIENGVPTEFIGVKKFLGYPRKILLTPGQYIIEMYWHEGGYEGRPTIAVETKAGYTYVLRCEAVPHEPNEQDMVRVVVDSIKKNL